MIFIHYFVLFDYAFGSTTWNIVQAIIVQGIILYRVNFIDKILYILSIYYLYHIYVYMEMFWFKYLNTIVRDKFRFGILS